MLTLAACSLLIAAMPAQSAGPQTFSTMRNVELADHLRARASVSGAEDIALLTARTIDGTIGQRFRLNASRFDLSESDCVVLVERSIAMVLADGWHSYYLLMERLRHKNGDVEYRNRNFATLADWLPNNAWLLQDLTTTIANEGLAQEFTHAVRPKRFKEEPAAPGSRYTRIRFLGSDYSKEPEVRTNWYLPSDSLDEVASNLHDGDVILLLRTSSGGHLGCNHLGLIRKMNGKVFLVNSEPPEVRNLELKGLFMDPRLRGFKVLRLRQQASEIARAEVAKMITRISVPSPGDVDKRVESLRQSRQN